VSPLIHKGKKRIRIVEEAISAGGWWGGGGFGFGGGGGGVMGDLVRDRTSLGQAVPIIVTRTEGKLFGRESHSDTGAVSSAKGNLK